MNDFTQFRAGLIIISTLTLMACQPEQHTQAQSQQNFICKSLIQGFLSAQKLTQYELEQIQPITSGGLHQQLYIYKAKSENGMNMMPQQAKLRFACEQMTARQFQIKLHPHPFPEQALLSIELPEAQHMQQLTAFRLPEQRSH